MPSLALNKIVLADANANSTAAYFVAGSTGLTSGASSVLAAGSYFFYPVANVAVQVNNKSDGTGFANVMITGTSSNTAINYVANASSGFVISDGTNVRITNVGGQLATASYVVVGSETTAPDTYGD